MKKNYIITNRPEYFEKIGSYNYCTLDEVIFTSKMACDTETTSLQTLFGEIFAIQIGTNKHNYLFDIDSIDIQLLINKLKKLNPILVFHNSKFDLGFLYKYNYFPKRIRDTMLASQILYNGLVNITHNFKDVMERELRVIYDKTEQGNIAIVKLSTKSTIDYCFNDVDKLLDLEYALNKKLYDGGYVLAYKEHCRWIRSCAYMEQCGIPINEKEWIAKIESDKIELIKAQNQVIEYIWDNLPKYREPQLDLFSNEKRIITLLSSPQQMIPVFQDFNINTKDSEGKDSISEDIIGKSKHEFIKIWLHYKEKAHDVSTYGENFLEHIYNGRLYTRYKPLLDTARISSGGKDKIHLSSGSTQIIKFPNVLNLPATKSARKPFEAKPGFKYIVCDYQGQETILGADITNDKTMVNSVLDNQDLHCAFARVLFPEIGELTDEEIIKDHKDKRNASKAPRFLFQK